MAKPTVPFKRPLYPPDAAPGKTPSPPGDDVVAVKRAISRAGFWSWQTFDQAYSNGFAHGVGDDGGQGGVAEFQRSTGIQATGWYGKPTHDALVAARVPKGAPRAGEWRFDTVAVRLYNGSTAGDEAAAVMRQVETWCDWLVAREAQISYSQQRPIQPLWAMEEPPRLPSLLDCSGGVIYVAWLAGAEPSPDALYGYGGFGNTGSLIRAGTRIPEADARKAAERNIVLAFYGDSVSYPGHVTMLLRDGRNWSMGRNAGPEYTSGGVRYRSDLLQLRAYPVVR